jgi:hypothetical protein
MIYNKSRPDKPFLIKNLYLLNYITYCNFDNDLYYDFLEVLKIQKFNC